MVYTQKTTRKVLSSGGAAAVSNLEVVELSLELLDGAVSHLEVLVESVTFGDELEKDKRQQRSSSQVG